MNDPAKFIRKKIITALTGNISSGGSVVPVYGTVPGNATFPHIRVYGVNLVEVDQNRTSFTTEVTSRIEVVTRFAANQGGELTANTLISNCLNLLRVREGNYFDLTSDGFKVYTSVAENINYLRDDTKSHTLYRAILELQNRVIEI
tara:strand:+ start:3014 stop:3451 length:438 start_codon:yes stop_codon:yes gene_type:complete